MTNFPRQQARTRRFTLGVPRGFTPGLGADGGPVVLFLRTDAGDDPVTHLWRHDPRTGTTDKLVDARSLGEDGELPAEERARRERAREQAGGIVSYAVDDRFTMAAFALAGRLHSVDVRTGAVAEHVAAAFDPRPSPDGRAIAYHAADGLHLVELDGSGAASKIRPLVQEDGVAWGRAEFVAGEEMGRTRGFWWAGDSSALAVARVDERSVPVWTLADPANPWSEPVAHRYPAAGTVNADVSLWVVDRRTGERVEVDWRGDDGEYLAHVGWGDGPLTLLVQSRDQRTARCLTVDAATGRTDVVRAWHDEAWIELVPGAPRWHGDRLVTVEDRAEVGTAGSRMVCLDGVAVGPPDLQVRELVGLVEPQAVAAPGDGRGHDGHASALVLASGDDPTVVGAWLIDLVDGGVRPATADGAEGGVTRVVLGRAPSGSAVPAPDVVVRATLEAPSPDVSVRWAEGGEVVVRELDVVAEMPVITASPRLLTVGTRDLRAALLLPGDDAGSGPLPVVLDPYGGPHAQRVLQAGSAFLTSQWLADQGFAVLVVDGRGSPGRGPRWEREVRHDLATPVLDDQIDALHAVARIEPRLDLTRVGIRGWSFGGYLAALAALRRPDVFRAAVAGAPVTDWRLYDTHYTERYLGDPAVEGATYAVSSVVAGDGILQDASPWPAEDPPSLLLIHGLADDNVVAAHSLRLSAALLADGRSHRFLPLSGVTHMTPQETVAENLLTEQVRFLQEALR